MTAHAVQEAVGNSQGVSEGRQAPAENVYYEGKQDEQIRGYLVYRNLIMDIMKDLNIPETSDPTPTPQ